MKLNINYIEPEKQQSILNNFSNKLYLLTNLEKLDNLYKPFREIGKEGFPLLDTTPKPLPLASFIKKLIISHSPINQNECDLLQHDLDYLEISHNPYLINALECLAEGIKIKTVAFIHLNSLKFRLFEKHIFGPTRNSQHIVFNLPSIRTFVCGLFCS